MTPDTKRFNGLLISLRLCSINTARLAGVNQQSSVPEPKRSLRKTEQNIRSNVRWSRRPGQGLTRAGRGGCYEPQTKPKVTARAEAPGGWRVDH